MLGRAQILHPLKPPDSAMALCIVTWPHTSAVKEMLGLPQSCTDILSSPFLYGVSPLGILNWHHHIATETSPSFNYALDS